MSVLGSSFKENRPPAIKRTASVSGLFDQTERLRQKHAEAARDPLAPRPSGIKKPTTTKGPNIFAEFRGKPKPNEHPIYTEFKEVVHEYNQDAGQARGDELQPILSELLARVDGADGNGRLLESPDLPSQTDIAALSALEDDLSKPLDDDVLELKARSGKITTVRLGDVIRDYEVKSEKKREELAVLLEELSAVDDEIADVQREALRSEQTGVKKRRQELGLKLDGFKEEALRIKQQTDAEIHAALKVEKKAKKEWEAKIAALMD